VWNGYNIGMPHIKGIPRPIEVRRKISNSLIGRYMGSSSPHWKGGRSINYAGYVMIYSPNHPMSTKAGVVFEHRLVMEKKLGRYLNRGEIVHHINHIRDDNREENLILLSSNTTHIELHGSHKGKNNPNFKHGKSRSKEYVKEYGRVYRSNHRKQVNERNRRYYLERKRKPIDNILDIN